MIDLSNWIFFLGAISCFINIFGIWADIKIPFYKGKWDKKKKTPIYKLELDTWDDHYKIHRYKIEYTCYFWIFDNILITIFSTLFLPFSSWFKFPYYEREDGRYGKFTKDELKDINFNIGEYYELERKKAWDKYYKKLEKENYEKNILNNINKDFNIHYNGKN